MFPSLSHKWANTYQHIHTHSHTHTIDATSQRANASAECDCTCILTFTSTPTEPIPPPNKCNQLYIRSRPSLHSAIAIERCIGANCMPIVRLRRESWQTSKRKDARLLNKQYYPGTRGVRLSTARDARVLERRKRCASAWMAKREPERHSRKRARSGKRSMKREKDRSWKKHPP